MKAKEIMFNLSTLIGLSAAFTVVIHAWQVRHGSGGSGSHWTSALLMSLLFLCNHILQIPYESDKIYELLKIGAHVTLYVVAVGILIF